MGKHSVSRQSGTPLLKRRNLDIRIGGLEMLSRDRQRASFYLRIVEPVDCYVERLGSDDSEIPTVQSFFDKDQPKLGVNLRGECSIQPHYAGFGRIDL
jgi:hypothetical protein